MEVFQMSIAKHILKEEHDNLMRQLERTQREIEQLPKGSIRYKKINGKEYPYLQYKENGQVKSALIKKNEDTEKVGKEVERRKKLKIKSRQLIEEIREIERVLKRQNKRDE